MIRSLALDSALVFSLLVGGEAFFLANQAYAACCMCGTCRYGCTCPGIGSCPKCNAPDPLMQYDIPQALNGDGVDVIIRGVNEALSSIASLSVNTNRLMRLAEGGQCANVQQIFRLKILDKPDTQNLVSASLNTDLIQNSIVALQMSPDKEH